MSEQPRQTLPISESEQELAHIYRKAFAEEVVQQGQRFDELSKMLFSIELTALTAYILLLRFIFPTGFPADDLLAVGLVASTAILWTFALIATLYGFFPKRYTVMDTVVEAHPAPQASTDALTLLEYYTKVAQDKQFYVLLAIGCFFMGLVCVILTVMR